jgi:hypothetical protein
MATLLADLGVTTRIASVVDGWLAVLLAVKVCSDTSGFEVLHTRSQTAVRCMMLQAQCQAAESLHPCLKESCRLGHVQALGQSGRWPSVERTLTVRFSFSIIS